MDFTEAVNKFVIGHLTPGSKSHISFKSFLDEYEDYYDIEKGTSEIKYRESCIYKMLDRIASKIIEREVDLKEYKQDEFSYDEIETLVKRRLDIFNQEPPRNKEKEEDIALKEKLNILAKRPEDREKEENKEETKAEAKQKEWIPRKITEKEENVVKDTIDYIMDGQSYIKLSGLIELMGKDF